MNPLREIALVLAVVAGFSLVGERDFQDSEIAEKIARDVQEARAFPPCDGATLKQWGAAERWAPKGEDVQAECAPAARRVPDYVLSVPCNHDGERCR